MKTVTLGVLGVALGVSLVNLAACTSIVGITDLPSLDGGTSAGGGDGGGVAAFVGTWTVSSGSNTVTCSGQAPKTTQDTGLTVTVARGSSSDLVTTGGCGLEFNVTSTDTATLLPSQSCTDTATDGEQITIYPTGTFVINAAGTTGTVTFTGTATDSYQGESVSCAFTETDQYTKN